ncbi:MAG: primosomal replication protein N [Methylophilaceae bacterium]
MNKLAISGEVAQLEALRYTPAGLPLLSFVINHVSEVTEAGLKRKVECDVKAVAVGSLATSNIQLGTKLNALGFLAKRSAKSTQLVMHIKNIELI